MRYEVMLNWGNEYIFDDGEQAMIFATMAANASTERHHITIEIILPEVEEDEKND